MSKSYIISRTSMFIAMMVAVQYITSVMGQLVTGCAVNFVLIACCLLVGTKPAVAVGIISPFVAKLFGIGPALLPIVPVVSAANAVLITGYGLIMSNRIKLNETLKWIIAIICASLLKFAVLTICVGKIIIPILNVQEPIASTLAKMFGISQLITAIAGGVIAVITVPIIKKALKIKSR